MINAARKRRVLLVTSALPPAMLADSQRARILAYTLPAAGWDVEVLAPNADFQIPIYMDAAAAALRPQGILLHEVAPHNDRLLRAAGMKSMSWRALWPMYRRGCEVLGGKQFDLVYISTTQFNFFCLGALWKRKLGVPYVLDFHDPWFRETSQYETTARNWKYHFSVRSARYMEWFALNGAGGLVAVSPAYLDQLRRRYPGFRSVQPEATAAIPFGVADGDLTMARAISSSPALRPLATFEIVYAGAGRSIMAKSFRRICQGLARLKQREPDLVNDIRIRLLGTYAYWRPGEPTELQALAEGEGVGELVEEKPARIGYVAALGMALRADGLLVLGVDDPAYMPSKLFLYALTGKPLLVCMHVNSQVNDYFERWPELGTLIHFSGLAEAEAEEDARLMEFLKWVAEGKIFPRESIRAAFSAAAMARRHVELFERCIKSRTEN